VGTVSALRIARDKQLSVIGSRRGTGDWQSTARGGERIESTSTAASAGCASN